MDAKKTLKKMSKLELLELLAEQEREIQALKQQLEEKDRCIEQRTLRLKRFGNLAQAALSINEVLEAAQKAADQYVDSIKAVVEDRLQRDGVLPYVAKIEHEEDEHVAVADSAQPIASEEERAHSVDAILRSIYEYEVLDECADSMKKLEKTTEDERGKSE